MAWFTRNRCRGRGSIEPRARRAPAQRGSLLDAEAVLLVDDDEPGPETHALLKGVGPHDDERL